LPGMQPRPPQIPPPLQRSRRDDAMLNFDKAMPAVLHGGRLSSLFPAVTTNRNLSRSSRFFQEQGQNKDNWPDLYRWVSFRGPPEKTIRGSAKPPILFLLDGNWNRMRNWLRGEDLNLRPLGYEGNSACENSQPEYKTPIRITAFSLAVL
jgi:hypothetical protein